MQDSIVCSGPLAWLFCPAWDARYTHPPAARSRRGHYAGRCQQGFCWLLRGRPGQGGCGPAKGDGSGLGVGPPESETTGWLQKSQCWTQGLVQLWFNPSRMAWPLGCRRITMIFSFRYIPLCIAGIEGSSWLSTLVISAQTPSRRRVLAMEFLLTVQTKNNLELINVQILLIMITAHWTKRLFLLWKLLL
jgi:hypothetical protein